MRRRFAYPFGVAGQTLTEIRALLDARGLSPQHRFGQNFLIDLNHVRKIVAAAELSKEDIVLEVGPGTGSLTELLLDTGARVIAIEIDRGFQELLRERLGDQPRFTLIGGDALAGKHVLNPEMLAAIAAARATTRRVGPDASEPAHHHDPAQRPTAGPDGERDGAAALKLVANLPYQIATPLLVDLLLDSQALGLARMVVTIQKEVGERLAAPAGTAAYGPVSVIVQTLAQVELLATLPAGVFWPPPQVESVVVRITPDPAPALSQVNVPSIAPLHASGASAGQAGRAPASPAHAGGSAKLRRAFASFVQGAFAQRRKMLRRLVKEWGGAGKGATAEARLDTAAEDPVFALAGVSSRARPEELTPNDWQRFFAAAIAAGRVSAGPAGPTVR